MLQNISATVMQLAIAAVNFIKLHNKVSVKYRIYLNFSSPQFPKYSINNCTQQSTEIINRYYLAIQILFLMLDSHANLLFTLTAITAPDGVCLIFSTNPCAPTPRTHSFCSLLASRVYSWSPYLNTVEYPTGGLLDRQTRTLKHYTLN